MAQIISKKAKNILCARNFPEDKKDVEETVR